MGASAEHWDEAYLSGDRGRSWRQSQAAISIQLIDAAVCVHVTLFGAEQQFAWTTARRR